MIKNKYQLALFLITLNFLLSAQQTNIQFDNSILDSLGIAKSQIESAIDDVNSVTGEKNVGIYLNEQYLGSGNIYFLNGKQICFNDKTLALLQVNRKFFSKPEGKESKICRNPVQDLPITVNYHRNSNSLFLTIPAYALQDEQQNVAALQGGKALFLNYNNFYSINRTGNTTTQQVSGTATSGINYHNYLLRNFFSYSYSDKHGQVTVNESYLQKAFAKLRFRLGRLFVSNSDFGVGLLNGIDVGQDNQQESGIFVDIVGNAVNYSNLEVYQGNNLVYSTAVSAGSFHLRKVPLISASLDAKVIIRYQNQIQREFVISKAAFQVTGQSQLPMSFFIGQLDAENRFNHTLAVGGDWQLPRLSRWQPSLALVWNQRYQGVALKNFFDNALSALSYQNSLVLANNKETGNGVKLTQNVNWNSQRMGAYLQWIWQNRRYTDFGQDSHAFSVLAQSISVGAYLPFWANNSVNVSLYHQQYYQNGRSDTLSVSLNHTNRYFNINGSVSYDLLKNNQYGQGVKNDPWAFYLTANIPLHWRSMPEGSLQLAYNDFNQQQQWTSTLSQPITNKLQLSGGIGVNRDQQHQLSQNVYGQANWLAPYFNVNGNLSYSHYAYLNTVNFANNVMGALALTQQGLVFSPYELKDSFAVIDTGIRHYTDIETPSALVTTNFDGLAVAPDLTAYHTNTIRIVAPTLPEGTYIDNITRIVNVAPGTVAAIHFNSENKRNYLLKLAKVPAKMTMDNLFTNPQAETVAYFIDKNILLVNEEDVQFILKHQAYSQLGKQRCYLSMNKNYQALAVVDAALQCQ